MAVSVPRRIGFMLELDLIKRAASNRKLNLPAQNMRGEDSFHPAFASNVVGTFNIERGFVTALQGRGFSFGPGTGPTRSAMVYLSGDSDQGGAEIFESDCWAWKNTESHPYLTVYFQLQVTQDQRGVVCTPHVWGNCDGGACHRPTINNFLRVVSEHFRDVHSLITEAANTNFQPVVTWGEINMAGIKSVEHLFFDTYGQNKRVITLANSNLSPFEPVPFPKFSVSRVNDRLFVPDFDQPTLLDQWGDQLRAFRDSLV